MSISFENYDRKKHYDSVGKFLKETYHSGLFRNWLQPRWEYMHFHPNLDTENLWRIGIWKSGGEIVAMANYEDVPGTVYFAVRNGFEILKAEMLEYAIKTLKSINSDGRQFLRVFVNEFDHGFNTLLEGNGFKTVSSYSDCCSIFTIGDKVLKPEVPEDYEIISIEDENDLYKANRVLWRGFNHEGEPPAEGIAGRKLMQSAPNFRKDLNIIVKHKNGDFVAYSGIWLDHENEYAYVEPVATDPDHRRKGLGTAAVLECIRRCGNEGSKYAYVGSSQKFYLEMGFVKIFDMPQWIKYFD